MNKEELLLEIIEKVHERTKETSEKLEQVQLEQVRQGGILERNSDSLDEHMRRTIANEAQVELLKKQLQFYDTTVKVVAGLGTVILGLTQLKPVIDLFQNLFH